MSFKSTVNGRWTKTDHKSLKQMMFYNKSNQAMINIGYYMSFPISPETPISTRVLMLGPRVHIGRVLIKNISGNMRFPTTIWYVRPAKPQIRLCIYAV